MRKVQRAIRRGLNMNYEKCAVYEEDSDDIIFLTDKLIREGLTVEERKELDFLRVLNGI